MTQDRPYLSAFTDRHGKRRWRYRRAGKTVSLSGEPGEAAFEAAYEAAIAGRARPAAATVARLPGGAKPRSLAAAWRMVPKGDPSWPSLRASTRRMQTANAEAFLTSPVAPPAATTWGEVPVADLQRRHVKTILASRSDTPHAARHLLVVLRKMILIALDEEWITADPTYKVHWRPEYGGWRAWTEDERARFELRWPVGTTPRLAYALALWLGNRRGDVVALRVDQIIDGVAVFRQEKTGKAMRLAVTPMLREALDAADLSGPTVLQTAYGKAFSAKSLTGRMAKWTAMAGLPPGCTLHGLRKTLGRMLADGGATTRQIMDALGHDDIKHAELYTREAEAEALARAGLDKVTSLIGRKRRG